MPTEPQLQQIALIIAILLAAGFVFFGVRALKAIFGGAGAILVTLLGLTALVAWLGPMVFSGK